MANQPNIRNVGAAEVVGVEMEFAAQLSDQFRLDGSATYVDAEFTEGQLTEPLRPAPLTQPPGTLLRDLDGLRLPRSPRWKFNIGAQADLPVGEAGDLMLRFDYGWQSKIYYTIFNIEAASQDAYGVANARAAFTSADDRYTVALFANNLFDETHYSNQVLVGAFYGAEFSGPLAPPRTYGVEFGVRF